MGIPSYFSYIVKNHGSIIRKISALKNPVNNLYLDSNSIIYDVYRNIPVEGLSKVDYELKIYEAISNKISEYIEKVKPQDNIFIAFDSREEWREGEGHHNQLFGNGDCFTCKATVNRHDIANYTYGSPESKHKQTVLNRIKLGKLIEKTEY